MRILISTTVFGAFDHGCYGALQRAMSITLMVMFDRYIGTSAVSDVSWRPEQLKGPSLGNNDRPGIMLAGAGANANAALLPENELPFSPIMMMVGQPLQI